MKQRVKTVSYLAKAEFDIKNDTYDLVALPSGAEVVKCDLEVVGEVTAAKASVGFKDEKEVNFFLSEIDLPTHRYNTSAKCCTALDTKVISAKIVNASGNAKGVLRVLYFLPSETEVEY
ncbi:hypothetical protein [Helicobacter phage FrGC43A]|uniref:hypothetical protein n=1 Tax=Helicobacter pylori TaxID=210 RepID=UPI0009840848|nr:hypothetical protein [Helicobacter pylori]ANT42873.1 hypothetical protein [Helicobacter phage FrGC43A]PUD75350.1 hypothetical protein C2R64_05390 [Helicobacter pylori]WRG94648.1 hypothetical protein FNE14_03215 [Helicobacter pylori]